MQCKNQTITNISDINQTLVKGKISDEKRITEISFIIDNWLNPYRRDARLRFSNGT